VVIMPGMISATSAAIPWRLSLAVPARPGALAASHPAPAAAAGNAHSCVIESGRGYCWGHGNWKVSDVPVVIGPRAPTAVRALPGDAAARVSWKAPVHLDRGAVTGYTVTASPDGRSCRTAGATTCIITRLTNGTAYRVTVVVHTTAGDSGASARAAVTPAAARARAAWSRV
jgi:Fibronectin type III domain